MKYFLGLLTSLSFTLVVHAQAAEDSVKAVIRNLFTGMRNADVVLFKSAFSDSPVVQTITRNKEGKMMVVTENVNELVDYVSHLKKDSADEQIQFETIKIDGPLAIVWTPYNFYHNGKFSHCGVNSFQLVRLEDTWKIQYLVDTRRRTGCKP